MEGNKRSIRQGGIWNDPSPSSSSSKSDVNEGTAASSESTGNGKLVLPAPTAFVIPIGRNPPIKPMRRMPPPPTPPSPPQRKESQIWRWIQRLLGGKREDEGKDPPPPDWGQRFLKELEIREENGWDQYMEGSGFEFRMNLELCEFYKKILKNKEDPGEDADSTAVWKDDEVEKDVFVPVGLEAEEMFRGELGVLQDEATWELFMRKSIYWYIRSSIHELIFKIAEAKEEDQIQHLVECLFDLPYEHSNSTSWTWNYLRKKIYKVLMQTEVVGIRQKIAFWEAVKNIQKPYNLNDLAFKLMSDFEMQLQKQFTLSEAKEKESDTREGNYFDVGLLRTKDIDAQTILTSELQMSLYIVRSLKLTKMVRELILRNVISLECLAEYFLLTCANFEPKGIILFLSAFCDFMDLFENKLMKPEDKYFLQPLNPYQKTVLQIYGCLMILMQGRDLATVVPDSIKDFLKTAITDKIQRIHAQWEKLGIKDAFERRELMSKNTRFISYTLDLDELDRELKSLQKQRYFIGAGDDSSASSSKKRKKSQKQNKDKGKLYAVAESPPFFSNTCTDLLQDNLIFQFYGVVKRAYLAKHKIQQAYDDDENDNNNENEECPTATPRSDKIKVNNDQFECSTSL